MLKYNKLRRDEDYIYPGRERNSYQVWCTLRLLFGKIYVTLYRTDSEWVVSCYNDKWRQRPFTLTRNEWMVRL